MYVPYVRNAIPWDPQLINQPMHATPLIPSRTQVRKNVVKPNSRTRTMKFPPKTPQTAKKPSTMLQERKPATAANASKNARDREHANFYPKARR